MDAGSFIVGFTQSQMNLLRYVLILCHVIFIISAGIVTGGLLLSLVFRLSAFLRERDDYRGFSSLMVRGIAGRPAFWVFCLLVPYATQTFLLIQFYHESDFNFLPILSLGTILMIVSFLFFYLYIIVIDKKNFTGIRTLLPGIISFILLIGSIFLYSTTFSLLLDPEKWLFSRQFHRAILTWNGFTRFLFTLFLLFSVTGAWLIFNNSRKRYDFKFINNFSSAFFVFTIIPQPIMILWNAIFIPTQSITQVNLIIFAIIFLLLAWAAFSGLKILETGNFVSAGRILATILIVILFLSVNDLIARERALKGQMLNLRQLMEKVKTREEVVAEKKVPSKGEEVFTRACSGCHNFETKVVGPALRDVMPKYKDIKDLKAFIKNPVRVNPDFPQMPPLGLSDEEIDSVAGYLKERVER